MAIGTEDTFIVAEKLALDFGLVLFEKKLTTSDVMVIAILLIKQVVETYYKSDMNNEEVDENIEILVKSIRNMASEIRGIYEK